jgi:hypothetical protein
LLHTSQLVVQAARTAYSTALQLSIYSGVVEKHVRTYHIAWNINNFKVIMNVMVILACHMNIFIFTTVSLTRP